MVTLKGCARTKSLQNLGAWRQRVILTLIQIKVIFMRYLPTLRYLLILIALACTACGTALPSVKPYKLDIQQGNVVTSKMLLQLRPGMTKSQVRYIMGTPLIQDSFHGNRWDYVYQMREQGKVIEQRRVILDFENELLAKVRGDVTPSSGDKAATESDTTNTGTRTINPSAKPAEKGVLDKLKFWKKDEVKPENTKPTDATSPAKEVEKAAPEASKPTEAVQKVEDAVNQAVEAAPATAPALPTLPVESAPAEEGKSILSVPLELPSTTAPVAPAPVEQVPEVAPAKANPKVEVPEVETPKVAEPAKPVAVEPVATQPVESIKEKAVEKVLPNKEVEMRNAKSEVITPVESKAETEKYKENNELPEEDEPGFFDKMLEKIGF